MRAVVTRVAGASVTIAGNVNGRIGRGFLVLLGVGPNDTEETADRLAENLLTFPIVKSGSLLTGSGVAKGVEKRTKVKTRIVATALCELIENSERVIVMGHRFADMDSFGAAVGMLKLARNMGKPAVVAISHDKNLVQPLYRKMEENGYTDAFYEPKDLIEGVTDKTLLIVVDTHIEYMLESPELYRQCKNVVVIDHHRKMVGPIDNAVIFYHEPYASSASEMVTELAQYFNTKQQLGRVEAEAVLAGIMLDTKNFIIGTGALRPR